MCLIIVYIILYIIIIFPETVNPGAVLIARNYNNLELTKRLKVLKPLPG